MIDLCSYKTLSIITGLEPATIQEEAAFLALLLVGTGSVSKPGQQVSDP